MSTPSPELVPADGTNLVAMADALQARHIDLGQPCHWDQAQAKALAEAALAVWYVTEERNLATIRTLIAERDAALKVMEMNATSGGFYARHAESATKRADAAEARAATLAEENERLRAACIAAQISIGRFPGSVHDKAMAKIDRALGTVDPVYVDPDQAEIARLSTRAATLATRLAEVEGTLRALTDQIDDDTNDGIDNAGRPYQSQSLWDTLGRARAVLSPGDPQP